jgi:hypothetical protein
MYNGGGVDIGIIFPTLPQGIIVKLCQFKPLYHVR